MVQVRPLLARECCQIAYLHVYRGFTIHGVEFPPVVHEVVYHCHSGLGLRLVQFGRTITISTVDFSELVGH